MKDASLGENGQSSTIHAPKWAHIVVYESNRHDWLMSNSLITSNSELCLKQVL